MMTHHDILVSDVVAWCRRQGHVIVGFDLQLLIKEGETAKVAVVARNKRGQFLAVSPITIDGAPGLGIINLNTAVAEFARLSAPPGVPLN